MRWIVDTSVAIKWYFPEVFWQNSTQLLNPANVLCAPTYLKVEFDNVLAKKTRLGETTVGEALLVRSAFHRLAITFYDVFEFLDQAFAMALQTRCSVYDCTFLALAIRIGSEVVTADRRFFEAIAETDYRKSVTWIGDIDAQQRGCS